MPAAPARKMWGALDLGRGEEVGGRHAVAGQEPLHVSGGSVAGRTSIDHRDPPPGAAAGAQGAEVKKFDAPKARLMSLIIDGILQFAGGAMIVLGAVWTKPELARDESKLKVRPMQIGTGYGLGLGGAF